MFFYSVIIIRKPQNNLGNYGGSYIIVGSLGLFVAKLPLQSACFILDREGTVDPQP